MKVLSRQLIFPIVGALCLIHVISGAETNQTGEHVAAATEDVVPKNESAQDTLSKRRMEEVRVITTLSKFGAMKETGRLEDDPGRVRRQADSNTAVVGLRIMQGVTEQDYTRVKTTARRVERSARRTRRSIEISFDPHRPIQAGEQAVGRILHLPHQILNGLRGRPNNNNHRRPRPPRPSVSPAIIVQKIPPAQQPYHIHEYHSHQVFVPVYNPHSQPPQQPFVKLPQRPVVRVPVGPVVAQAPVIPVTASVVAPPPLPPIMTGRRALLTRTQEVFDRINFNVTLATRLRDEYEREVDLYFNNAGGYVDTNRVRANQRLIVVDPNGITCQDVCDTTQSQGTGYGTIGICTPNFCQCDFSRWQFTRYNCPGDTVFDPLLKVCNDPRNVVLCNDENLGDEPAGGYGGSAPSGPSGGYGAPTSGGYSDNSIANNNQNNNINPYGINASVAAAILLAALQTPASTKLINPVPTKLYNAPPLQAPTSGYISFGNQNVNNHLGHASQNKIDGNTLLSKFSPEQLQIFASLLAQAPTYTSNFAGHVNTIFQQQQQQPPPQYNVPQAPPLQYNAPQAPAPQYNAPQAPPLQYNAPQAPPPQYNAPQPQYNAPQAPAGQYGQPNSREQYSLLPSQEVLSYSQTEAFNQFAPLTKQELLTYITTTEQPHSGIQGLVPPAVSGADSTYGASSAQSHINSLNNDPLHQPLGHLTPEQIKQLTELAKHFVAQNAAAKSNNNNNSYGR